MNTLLDSTAQSVLAAERDILAHLRGLLEKLDADPATRAQLADVIAHLDALFLVVVVGEFNAGKSSVLNALFGERIMEEGPIPTTAKVTILRHGDEPMTRQLSEFLVEKRYPAELLKVLHLVDTPGTNSIIRRHQEITETFIPRADLLLFITSYDRPLSESERQFLSFVREAWGKKLVFVLNKIDLAENEQALEQVLNYLRESCREVLGFVPRIFPLSSRTAFAARTSGQPLAEAAPGFAVFEQFLAEHLAGPRQLALKLTSPLDTALSLLQGADKQAEARMRVLREDEQNLEGMQQQLDAARKALRESYRAHLAELDGLLLQMENKGVRFLDEAIRVGRIGLLRDKDRFKEEFSRQVVDGLDRQVEAQVTEAVDALIKHALRLWNEMMREFAERGRRASAEVSPAFLYNRAEVFTHVMKVAERKMTTYNVREEARRILENAQDATNLFQYAGAGAIGLGVLSGVLIATTALDAVGGFGLATAGALAVAGLTVLPRQRRKAIASFRERTETLRDELRKAVTAQLEEEMNHTLTRVTETIQPYADYVARERVKMDEVNTTRQALRDRLDRLRTTVQKAFGEAVVED